MRDPVKIALDRILEVLNRAGRDRKKITRELDLLKAEIRVRAGHKKSEWSEEYYAYLLEVYRQAVELAVDQTAAREEYEQAACLLRQKNRLEAEEPAENKLTKVF